MNQVTVTKTVSTHFSSSSGIVLLRHEIELPFIPFVGLILTEGAWEDTLTGVRYCTTYESWHCCTKPNEGLWDSTMEGQKRPDIDRIVEGYTKNGWSILKDERIY